MLENLYTDAPPRPKWNTESSSLEFALASGVDCVTELKDTLLNTVCTSIEDVFNFNKDVIGLFDAIRDAMELKNAPPVIINTHKKKRKPVKRRPRIRPKSPWFDRDCIIMKRDLNRLSKKYGKAPTNKDIRTLYYSKKKEYKTLIKSKKKLHIHKINAEIISGKEITWKKFTELKKLSTNNRQQNLDIFDIPKFYNFFKDLYDERKVDLSRTNSSKSSSNDTAVPTAILNDPVCEDEVHRAIKGLKNGKAVGLDLIANEYLKNSDVQMEEIITKLFNACLDLEVYPWNTTVISPLHKKGDIYNPDNYRAIAIGSNLGKLFSTILLNRLLKFREAHCPDTINQLGFCQGAFDTHHDTDLHIFFVQFPPICEPIFPSEIS